ncbi:outer membrane protein assembly factor BamC [Rugamonas sp.]|uniref:outer membrane protein assembly factor BamC n=1 Tax=Rugamonas sp. TaxID=1926287 RepID=UPI0025DDF315|nr:outer membrane protein assembly factor BamC [Rugamonas sp.]
MTIRKTATTSSQRALVLGALMASLTGCGMISSVVGSDKVDYKASKKAAPLDVPPDLTQLQKDNRYALPDSANGIATASGYNANKGAGPAAVQANGGEAVVPLKLNDIKVERSGNQRWLVVKQTPEQLWPQLKSFWEDSGFTLETENATAGIMETDWHEDRSKIPDGIIRNTLGKLFDNLYSSGQQDKFRTRIERLPDGGSEIYISHRGAQEVLTGAEKESTAWTPRANDPALEAQMLAQLMTKLGNTDDSQSAKTAVNNAIVQPQHATLVGEGAGRMVEVDEGFDRAWRRVGLALDRAGFTVEDRDRNQGTYFVRFLDADAKGPSKSWFSKLFSWGSSEEDKEAQRYHITVKAVAGTTTSQVAVQSNDGKPDTTPTAGKILTLLHEQLK